MGRITVKVHLDLDLVMTFFGGRVNCGKKERKGMFSPLTNILLSLQLSWFLANVFRFIQDFKLHNAFSESVLSIEVFLFS